MQFIKVKTHADGGLLAREEQLAWKIAEMAAGNQEADEDVLEMIGNLFIDLQIASFQLC